MSSPPPPAPAPLPGDLLPQAGRVSELFDQALDLSKAERERFLAGVERTDPTLGAEVRALLAASDAAVDFLPEDLPPAPHLERQFARLQAERAGERIGRYQLLQEIGEGGFGTVWMAEQLEPVTRRVALKIIKLGMDTREVIARFESERQALALMEHEHIAKVFDAGATQSGRPFFVMELVRGVPITEYCDQAQLGTRQRLALFADVCSAISHAHQKGVIHRDIKPSNVLVMHRSEQELGTTKDQGLGATEEKPIVKVIDFGIAKATQGRLTEKTLFTRSEMFIGTPAYMSPEQAHWSGLDVDTRSDIYSLGALLYELIAGRPPFDTRTMATAGYEEVRRIIGEVEPPRPSARLRTTVGEERARLAKARRTEPAELSRLVEPDLDWIVMKALEKDRTRRYQTAHDLAQDLAHFLADEPVTARPPSRTYLFRKFARRHRAALRVGAGILALLVAATAVSTWQAVRASQARQDSRASEALAQVEAARAKAQQQRADAEAERAQEQLYEAHMHLSLPTFHEHRGVVALRQLLGRWRPAPGEKDRRRWEWYYLSALPDRNVRTLRPAGREASTSVVWHAGTGRLAEGSVDGVVRIWDPERGVTAEALPGPVPELDFYGGRWLAWNPAGTRLAAGGRDGTVWMWDFTDAAREPRVWRTKGGPLQGVSFNADGRRLVAWAKDGWITLWQSDSGQVEAEFARRGKVSAGACSPDDRTLALGHDDGTVTLAAPTPGAPETSLAAHADQIYDLAWSPDSQRLATSGANEFWASVWDVASQQRVLGPLRHSHGVTSLAWDPGGERLATGSMDLAIKIWSTASGREEVVLRGMEDRVTALAWGPKGQLAAGGGFSGLRVWTSLQHQEWQSLRGDGRRITAVAWSPADGRLASAGDDGQVRIWQPPGEPARREIPAHRENAIYPEYGLIRALAWSPDGRQVASVGFDGAAKIWDPETGRELYSLPAEHGARWCLSWSPDGQILAVGSQDGTIQLLEGLPGPPRVRQIEAHGRGREGHPVLGGVRSLAWSPQGDRLASGGSDRLAKIWDTARGLEVQRLTGHQRSVMSLSWRPDGRQIVTASADATLALWDTGSGQRIWTVPAHNDLIDAVRWSPDGQRIASAGIDNSVRIWEPRTGGQCLVLRGKSGMFHDLSWSRDGRQLAAASSDGDVWIWAAGE